MTQQLSIALVGLFLASSLGCRGPYACGPCASVGGPGGVSCGEPISACGCGCSDAAADCGCSADDCGCSADDCGCSTVTTCETCRPNLRDCLPLFGAFFGCSGCSGDFYWSEWFSDPPDACDPCDRCGNWADARAGNCSTTGSAIPGGPISGCSTCKTGTTTATPMLEPTPMVSSLNGEMKR